MVVHKLKNLLCLLIAFHASRANFRPNPPCHAKALCYPQKNSHVPCTPNERPGKGAPPPPRPFR